jgi:hypothetical protein
MLRKALTLTLLILFICEVRAIDPVRLGGRSKALAHASVTLSDVWSVHHNIGSVGFIDKSAAGMTYENRYGFNELSTRGLSGVVALEFGAFGAEIRQFGFDAYNENLVALGYAMKLSKNISAGVKLNYQWISIQENRYENAKAVSADLGFTAQLNNDLTLGANIQNISNSSFDNYEDLRVPTIFRLGLGYTFSKQLLTLVEVEKDLTYPLITKFGMEYRPIDLLYLRGGFRTNDFRFAFGLGINWKWFQLDLGMDYQNLLGYTTQGTLVFSFQRD